MLNQQAPEKFVKGDGETLDLHSMFFTIQGEGPFTGHRSIFVRLAGCNLQCPGCDTEYTQGRRQKSVFDIVSDVIDLAMKNGIDPKKEKGLLVVITGGEPLRQPIGRLVQHLRVCGFVVQIESNGMFAPDPILVEEILCGGVTLVVSPKTAKINPHTADLASCFKYVLQAGYVDVDDGLPMFALEHMRGGRPYRHDKKTKIYLNPYDEKDTVKNKANLAACAESAMKYGHICGVQLHKYLGVE